MNQEYFQRWVDMTKNVQNPMQAMIELNVRTLRNFSYIKPNELAHFKAPEEFLEKQVQVTIENGHKALDYMKKSFEIIEKSLSLFVESLPTTAAASPLSAINDLQASLDVTNPLMNPLTSARTPSSLLNVDPHTQEMINATKDMAKKTLSAAKPLMAKKNKKEASKSKKTS